MRCPNCKAILCRIDYEHMPICTCPDCNGNFLDSGRLKRIAKKQEIRFDKSEADKLKTTKTGPEKEKKRVCPRCGNLMAKGRYRTTDVIIDSCKSCRGVWLDNRELEKVQVLEEAATAAEAASSGTNSSLAATLVGARTAFEGNRGESTVDQGYVADDSSDVASISIPGTLIRACLSLILIAFLIAWVSGIIHTLVPIDRIFDEDDLNIVDKYLPAILLLSAAAIAFTFRKITVKSGPALEIKQYVLGIPFTREYAQKELKCLGTDFSQSFFSGGSIWSIIFDIWAWGCLWAYWRISSQSRSLDGTSYLYVVLKSGKRIRIYRGANDKMIGNIADFLQSALGLEVRRL